MNTEQMSIHRALSELKNLDKRIRDAINRANFAGYKRVNADKVSLLDVSTYRTNSKTSLQQVDDLIRRKHAIKAAVVMSNAVCRVTIAGVEMTVAEAIYKKDSLDMEMLLLDKLKRTSVKVHNHVERFNAELSNEALEYFNEVTANKEKTSESSFKAMINMYKEEREVEVIEGFDVLSEIEKRNNEIEDFLTEVDFKLSESNAVTLIDIAY